MITPKQIYKTNFKLIHNTKLFTYPADAGVDAGADTAASPRLRMFDSIRSFALEHLDAAGATLATQTRHMRWMRTALHRAAEEAHDTPVLTWVARLRPELDNLRVALRHSLHHDPECSLELGTRATLLWQRAGLRHEAVRWLEAVRPLLARTTPAALRAGFAQAVGLLYVYGLHGLPAQAEAALQQAVQGHHELGDALNEYFNLYLLINTQLRVTPDADPRPNWQRMKALEAPDWSPMRTRYARQVEGMRLRDRGDAQGYRRFCVDERQRMRDAGDFQGQWSWTYGLALAEHDDGHAERAIALLDQTLEEVRAAGLLRSHTHVAAMLACMRLEQGQVPACLPQAREALNLLLVDGALWWMAGAMAYGAFWLGRAEDAARLVGWADALVARRGEKPGLFFARLRAGCEMRLRRSMASERFQALLDEGSTLDDASALRLAFD
jgi:hypothetical protein